MASGTTLDALRRIWTRLQGIATGGAQGQVLTKQSNDDFDADWGDPAAGGGGLDANAVDARIASPDTSATTERQGGVLIPSALNISDGTSSPFADAVRMFIDDHIEFTGPWSNNGPYRSGNVAEENNRLFQCMEDHDASDPFSSTPSPIASLSLNQGQVGYRRWVEITARDFTTNPILPADLDADLRARIPLSGTPAIGPNDVLIGGAFDLSDDTAAPIGNYPLNQSWRNFPEIYFIVGSTIAGQNPDNISPTAPVSTIHIASRPTTVVAPVSLAAANTVGFVFPRTDRGQAGGNTLLVWRNPSDTMFHVGSTAAADATNRGRYNILACYGKPATGGIITSASDVRIFGRVYEISENLYEGQATPTSANITESIENYEFYTLDTVAVANFNDNLILRAVSGRIGDIIFNINTSHNNIHGFRRRVPAA